MLTQKQINESWTVRSDNYNRYVEEEFATDRPEKWLHIIESNAPPGRPLRVLDAGCGPGFFSVLLSRAGHIVSGIDGSSGMLAHARENAAHFGVSRICCKGILVRFRSLRKRLTWSSAVMLRISSVIICVSTESGCVY